MTEPSRLGDDLAAKIAALRSASAKRSASVRPRCSRCAAEPVQEYGDTCQPCRDELRRDAGLLTPEEVIPPIFAAADFSKPGFAAWFDAPPEHLALFVPALKARQNVTVTGPAGAGKSSLAAAILRKYWRPKNRWVGAEELALCYRSTPLGTEPAMLEEAVRAPLAVLDDLGLEAEIREAAPTSMIFRRHQEQRPTIVTTGFDRRAIAARYGAGIARRLFDGCVIVLGAKRA